MKIEDYNKLMNDLKENLTDEGKATGIMSELIQDYQNVQNELSSLNTINEDLKNKNSSLQETNCNLFLKLTSEKKEVSPEGINGENKPKISDLKFENGRLFK